MIAYREGEARVARESQADLIILEISYRVGAAVREKDIGRGRRQHIFHDHLEHRDDLLGSSVNHQKHTVKAESEATSSHLLHSIPLHTHMLNNGQTSGLSELLDLQTSSH